MSTLSNDQLVARLAELEAENLAHEKRERARSDAAVYKQRQALTSHLSLGDRAHESLLRTQGRQHAGISIPAYPLLSNALFGLRGVTLLTAPYGIGKTTLTLNIARSVAAAGKCQVVYITTEMKAVALAVRMFSDIANSRGGGMMVQNGYITMQRLLVGDSASAITQEEKDKNRRDKKLQLGAVQSKNYEDAREIFDSLVGKSLHILDAKDIGSMKWSRSEREHSLMPLQRKVDEVTEGAEEVLIILDTIAHLEIQPSGAGVDVMGADYKDDLSQDRDITAGLREWREHLGETRALLAVHEESKARTGSGEGHSIRGSSRYAYGADALIQLIYADSGERNSNGGGGGSVDLKLRDPVSKDRIATAQIDAVINKARDGGYAGTLIAFDHEYDRALVKEVASYSRNEQKNKKKEARAEQKEERNLAQKRLEYQSGEKKPAKKEKA